MGWYQLRQELQKVAIDANVWDKTRHQIFLIVLEVVKKQAGKKLTKRVATALKKVLPEHTIYYDREVCNGFVMGTTIQIWGNGISFNDAIRLSLGSQDKVDVDVFEERNVCYGSAAAERIAEREVWLNDPGNVDRLIEANEMLFNAQTNFDEMVERYGCEASKYDIQKVLKAQELV